MWPNHDETAALKKFLSRWNCILAMIWNAISALERFFHIATEAAIVTHFESFSPIMVAMCCLSKLNLKLMWLYLEPYICTLLLMLYNFSIIITTWKFGECFKTKCPSCCVLTGCLPTLATIPVWIGLYQALSNVANEVNCDTKFPGLLNVYLQLCNIVHRWSSVHFHLKGLLTEGFFWIPSLGGPTTIAARQSGSGISWLIPFVVLFQWISELTPLIIISVLY